MFHLGDCPYCDQTLIYKPIQDKDFPHVLMTTLKCFRIYHFDFFNSPLGATFSLVSQCSTTTPPYLRCFPPLRTSKSSPGPTHGTQYRIAHFPSFWNPAELIDHLRSEDCVGSRIHLGIDLSFRTAYCNRLALETIELMLCLFRFPPIRDLYRTVYHAPSRRVLIRNSSHDIVPVLLCLKLFNPKHLKANSVRGKVVFSVQKVTATIVNRENFWKK
eukprot:scaffold3849_cov179-Amphora_coffeaeformis.AAC.32